MAEPLRILAFTGMNRRLNTRVLGPQQEAPTPAVEVRNLNPAKFPSLIPRKAMRFIHEDASPNTIWPLTT